MTVSYAFGALGGRIADDPASVCGAVVGSSMVVRNGAPQMLRCSALGLSDRFDLAPDFADDMYHCGDPDRCLGSGGVLQLGEDVEPGRGDLGALPEYADRASVVWSALVVMRGKRRPLALVIAQVISHLRIQGGCRTSW